MATRPIPHVAYPHHPGTLYDCLACGMSCYCADGFECVGCAESFAATVCYAGGHFAGHDHSETTLCGIPVALLVRSKWDDVHNGADGICPGCVSA